MLEAKVATTQKIRGPNQGRTKARSGRGSDPIAGIRWPHIRPYLVTIGEQCWQMPKCERFKAFNAAAVLLSILALGACVTSTSMDARAEMPDHPETAGFMALENVPARPDRPAMTAEEQSKLKKELSAARDRQSTAAKARDAKRAEPVKP